MLENTNLALVASTSKRQITLYELFDEYLRNYSYSNNSKYNAEHYILKIKKYFKDIDINDINRDLVQDYINHLTCIECLGKSYINNLFSRLKAVLNYAISKNYIEYNVCDNKVKFERVRHVKRSIDFSKKFIRKILKMFKKTYMYNIVYFDLQTRIT